MMSNILLLISTIAKQKIDPRKLRKIRARKYQKLTTFVRARSHARRSRKTPRKTPRKNSRKTFVQHSGLLSPISCFLSLSCCLLSPVLVSLSPISCFLSPVSCLLSPVSCLLSPVSCLSASRQSEVLRTSCACLAQALRGIDVSSPSWMDGG